MDHFKSLFQPDPSGEKADLCGTTLLFDWELEFLLSNRQMVSDYRALVKDVQSQDNWKPFRFQKKYSLKLETLMSQVIKFLSNATGKRFLVTTAEKGYTLKGLSSRVISRCFSLAQKDQITASGLRVPSIWNLPYRRQSFKPILKDIFEEIRADSFKRSRADFFKRSRANTYHRLSYKKNTADANHRLFRPLAVSSIRIEDVSPRSDPFSGQENGEDYASDKYNRALAKIPLARSSDEANCSYNVESSDSWKGRESVQDEIRDEKLKSTITFDGLKSKEHRPGTIELEPLRNSYHEASCLSNVVSSDTERERGYVGINIGYLELQHASSLKSTRASIADSEKGTAIHLPGNVELVPQRNATFLERARALFQPGNDEAEPLFNRGRLTEATLVMTAQLTPGLLTQGSDGSSSSHNAKILKQFATICNAIAFLCCFFSILVCGRRPGHAARTITSVGYIALGFGFVGMTGMTLSDEPNLWFTAATCATLLPIFIFASMIFN